MFAPQARGLAASLFRRTRDVVRRESVGDGQSSGPGWRQHTYVDGDVMLFAAGAVARGDTCGVFAQISEIDHLVVAVEGYIVNLGDLAAGCGAPGAAGRGEMLARLVLRHGPPILARLNGAHSVIVWDKTSRTAVVQCCRWGQRNLYLRSHGSEVAIASDLPALQRLTKMPFDLDARVLALTAMHGYPPATSTVVTGVTRALPGSRFVVTRAGVTHEPAAPVSLDTPGDARTTAFYADRLDAALTGAVRRFSSVATPQTVMVGSGVDSSLVAAYARREIASLTAVTQQMPAELDESREARQIVSALGIPHLIVPYEPRGDTLLGDVTAFVRIAEEPAYWNQLGPPLLHLLTRLAPPPPAFLTGAEGDLLFNFRLPRRVSIRRVARYGLLWPVARHTARRLVNRVTRHTYVVGADFDLLDRGFLRQHFGDELAAGLDSPHDAHATPPPPGTPEDAQRHFRDNGWQNVRIVCQLAGSVGSEVFFPYLDDDVMSCVLALPNELKLNKMLLRVLLRRFLPRRIVPATKKGYWAHTVKWHAERGGLTDVWALLDERRTRERGLCNAVAVRRLIETYRRGAATPRHHPVLWQLLLLEIFCREFIDAPRS
jgi:asparagine synthetase B (glutamine-hydrolysing)